MVSIRQALPQRPNSDLVKTKVAVEHRQQVACGDGRGMLALQLLQPVDIRLRDRKRDDADRHHFELLADGVDLPHLLRRQSAHHGAAVGNALHQALLLQFEQRKSHVAAMGLKQIAEILLDQALPRLAPPEHDVLLDALGDDRGGRGLARRRCRDLAGFRRTTLRWFG